MIYESLIAANRSINTEHLKYLMDLEPGALSDGDYQDLIKIYDTMSVVNGAEQVEAFINCTYKPHFEKVNGDQYHVTYTMSPVLEELGKRYRNYVTQCQKVEGGAVPMDVRDLRASILQKACQGIRQLDGGIVTDTRPKGVWEEAKRSIKACWEDKTGEMESILEGDLGDKMAAIHEAVLTWGMAPVLMSQLEMVVGADAAASIREKAEAVREFNHGMIVGEFLWAKATAEGVVNLPQTAVTLAAAIAERGVLPVAADMVVGIAENVSKVWKEDVVHGDARSRGRVAGRVLPDVILAVFGAVKGIKKVKAAKSAKAGTTADTAADAVKLADEISDVGRTGDVLEEIKVVDKVDDVIKEGSGNLKGQIKFNKPIKTKIHRGIEVEFVNPSANKVRLVEQAEKNISIAIDSAKNSKNPGKAIEGKVGNLVSSKKEITHFGVKVENMTTGSAAGDIDIATKSQFIEVKKSTNAIDMDQIKKYIDPNHVNFFNYDNKEVILYIDDPINMSKTSVKQLIQDIENLGVKVVNSLDELEEVLK